MQLTFMDKQTKQTQNPTTNDDDWTVVKSKSRPIEKRPGSSIYEHRVGMTCATCGGCCDAGCTAFGSTADSGVGKTRATPVSKPTSDTESVSSDMSAEEWERFLRESNDGESWADVTASDFKASDAEMRRLKAMTRVLHSWTKGIPVPFHWNILTAKLCASWTNTRENERLMDIYDDAMSDWLQTQHYGGGEDHAVRPVHPKLYDSPFHCYTPFREAETPRFIGIAKKIYQNEIGFGQIKKFESAFRMAANNRVMVVQESSEDFEPLLPMAILDMEQLGSIESSHITKDKQTFCKEWAARGSCRFGNRCHNRAGHGSGPSRRMVAVANMRLAICNLDDDRMLGVKGQKAADRDVREDSRTKSGKYGLTWIPVCGRIAMQTKFASELSKMVLKRDLAGVSRFEVDKHRVPIAMICWMADEFDNVPRQQEMSQNIWRMIKAAANLKVLNAQNCYDVNNCTPGRDVLENPLVKATFHRLYAGGAFFGEWVDRYDRAVDRFLS